MKELVVVTILLISIAVQSYESSNDPVHAFETENQGHREVNSRPPYENPYDPRVLIDKKPDEIVKRVNEVRKEAAKHANITNMATVKWDEGLAAKVKTLSSNCDAIKPNGYRFVFCDVYMGGRMIQIDLEMFTEYPEEDAGPREDIRRRIDSLVAKNKDARTFAQLEFVYPPQTKIGCARHSCNGTLPSRKYYSGGDPYSVSYICLLGDVSEAKSDLIQFKEESSGAVSLGKALVFPILLAAIFVRLQI